MSTIVHLLVKFSFIISVLLKHEIFVILQGQFHKMNIFSVKKIGSVLPVNVLMDVNILKMMLRINKYLQ
jgi:hypothetical protein